MKRICESQGGNFSSNSGFDWRWMDVRSLQESKNDLLEADHGWMSLDGMDGWGPKTILHGNTLRKEIFQELSMY